MRTSSRRTRVCDMPRTPMVDSSSDGSTPGVLVGIRKAVSRVDSDASGSVTQ